VIPAYVATAVTALALGTATLMAFVMGGRRS